MFREEGDGPFPPSLHIQLKDCWRESLWDKPKVGNKIDADPNYSYNEWSTPVDDVGTLPKCPWILFFSFFPQFLYTPGHFVSISQQLQLFFWRTVFSLQILLCLWTGELKRAWKFRSPEGGLDQ